MFAAFNIKADGRASAIWYLRHIIGVKGRITRVEAYSPTMWHIEVLEG